MDYIATEQPATKDYLESDGDQSDISYIASISEHKVENGNTCYLIKYSSGTNQWAHESPLMKDVPEMVNNYKVKIGLYSNKDDTSSDEETVKETDIEATLMMDSAETEMEAEIEAETDVQDKDKYKLIQLTPKIQGL